MPDPRPPGSSIGPYLIEVLLGRGGMGAVYRGRHRETGAIHAVKVLASPAGLAIAAEEVARFRREIELLARSDALPGMIRIHTAGAEGDTSWFAMELLPGPSLADDLRRGPLPARRAATVVRDVARAVAHLHGSGMLHRDLKPANVVFDAEGRPRLTDFGLAFDPDLERLTQSGEAIGTPSFMAPEQITTALPTGEKIALGPPTDVYGLGAVLHACLTGCPPFASRDVRSTLVAVLDEAPPVPSGLAKDVPEPLDAVCARALAKLPGARYPTAAAFADDLDLWLADRADEMRALSPTAVGPEGRRRPERLAIAIVAAITVVSLIAAVALGAFRPDSSAALARAERLAERGSFESAAEALARVRRGDLDAEPGRRAVALEQALAIVNAPPGEAISATRALSRAVRPGDHIDEPLLRRVERVLHAGRRPLAVHELLHEATLVAKAGSPDIARAVAELIADRESGLTPPTDPSAFGALVEPRVGLSRETRGRLELGRLLALPRADDAQLDVVLDGLVDLHHATGIVPAPADWSESLRQRAVARVLAVVSIERPPEEAIRRASEILRLLVGAGHRVEESLSNDRAQQLDVEVIFGAAASIEIDPEATPREIRDRWLLAAAIVEASGWSAIHEENYNWVARVLSADEVKEIARDSLAEGRVPHASLLAILARVVVKSTAGPFIADRGVWLGWAVRRLEKALERHPPTPWLLYTLGELLDRAGESERAISVLGEALELDRTRPELERLPVIIEVLVTAHLEGHAPCAHADELVPLHLEAGRLAEAQRRFAQPIRPLKRRYRGPAIADRLIAIAELIARRPAPPGDRIHELASTAHRLLEGEDEESRVPVRQKAEQILEAYPAPPGSGRGE